jgi:hypothetical protein
MAILRLLIAMRARGAALPLLCDLEFRFGKQCQRLKLEIDGFSDIFINDISRLPDAATLRLLTLVLEGLPVAVMGSPAPWKYVLNGTRKPGRPLRKSHGPAFVLLSAPHLQDTGCLADRRLLADVGHGTARCCGQRPPGSIARTSAAVSAAARSYARNCPF